MNNSYQSNPLITHPLTALWHCMYRTFVFPSMVTNLFSSGFTSHFLRLTVFPVSRRHTAKIHHVGLQVSAADACCGNVGTFGCLHEDGAHEGVLAHRWRVVSRFSYFPLCLHPSATMRPLADLSTPFFLDGADGTSPFFLLFFVCPQSRCVDWLKNFQPGREIAGIPS